MTPEAGLVLSRFLHDAALTIIFGASLFQFYAGSASSLRSLRGALLVLAALALLSAASWLSFTAANMQGDIAGATDLATTEITVPVLISFSLM